MGVALALGSLLSIGIALTYRPAIIALVANFPLPMIPERILTETGDALAQLASTIFNPLLIEAIVLLALGVILFIVASVLRPDSAATAPIDDTAKDKQDKEGKGQA
jgi:hypothetical protein